MHVVTLSWSDKRLFTAVPYVQYTGESILCSLLMLAKVINTVYAWNSGLMRNGGNCLRCPRSLPWCPLKCSNRKSQIPHRGALYQRKIALPLQVHVWSIRPVILITCTFNNQDLHVLLQHNEILWSASMELYSPIHQNSILFGPI